MKFFIYVLCFSRLFRNYRGKLSVTEKFYVIFYGIDRLVSCNTADTAVLHPQVVIVRTACLLEAELFGIPLCTLIIDLFAVAAVIDLNAVYPLRQELLFHGYTNPLHEKGWAWTNTPPALCTLSAN